MKIIVCVFIGILLYDYAMPCKLWEQAAVITCMRTIRRMYDRLKPEIYTYEKHLDIVLFNITLGNAMEHNCVITIIVIHKYMELLDWVHANIKLSNTSLYYLQIIQYNVIILKDVMIKCKFLPCLTKYKALITFNEVLKTLGTRNSAIKGVCETDLLIDYIEGFLPH